MSNCLIDWIGIQGCHTLENFSGVFLNQLPGLNLESLEKVADSEQVNYLGVWNDIQTRGVKKFANRVQMELSKRYQFKNLKATVDLGGIIDNTFVASENCYRGFTYELKLKNQYRKSNFQSLYVQKLKLYNDSGDDTVHFKIVDLDTGTVLWSKDVAINEGWNIVQVNQVFTSQRILFCYDDTVAGKVKMPINDSNADWFNTMHWSIYGPDCCHGLLKGAKTNALDVFDKQAEIAVIQGNDTFGLSGVFSLVCNFDFLLCNNKQLFTTALWYMMGMEACNEILYSGRLNRYTTVDKDKAEKLLKYFETEFEAEMGIIVDGIRLSTKDACVECNTQIQQLEPQL